MAKGKKATAKAVKSTLEDKVEVVPEEVVTPEEVVVTPETGYTVTIPEVPSFEDILSLSEPSPYDEDIEVLPPSEPIPAEGKEWVANASLLKKVEGYRDTLNGTLYLGVRK